MNELVATMAGTVLNVLVEEGDEVSAGDTLVMLESMKMEIPVEAQNSGKISNININVGDFVNEGDVLITIE